MGDQSFAFTISIVMPAYKERENLAILIPEVEKSFAGILFEIIIVDDNSQDGTVDLLSDFQEQFGNIHVIERAGLLGIGSALRVGYNAAQGRYILSSDADLSFSAEDMCALYQKIQQGYDMVLGYKVPPRGAPIRAKDHMSVLGNWVVRHVTRLRGLKNFNTNFRIFRASLWRQITTRENRNFFLLETIIKAKRKGANITEIPVTFYDRKFGQTKLNFLKEGPRYLYKLIRYTFFAQKRP